MPWPSRIPSKTVSLFNIQISTNIINCTNKGQKICNHLNRCQKSVWRNPTFIRGLNPQQIRNRKQLSSISMKNPQLTSSLPVKIDVSFLKLGTRQGYWVLPFTYLTKEKTREKERKRTMHTSNEQSKMKFTIQLSH